MTWPFGFGTPAIFKPRFQEDNYNTDITMEQGERRWSIHYIGLLNVRVDHEGTVHISGTLHQCHGGNNYYPSIKLEGNANFRVSHCDRVTVDAGPTVEVHNCSLVRSRKKCKIDAHNCTVAEVWGERGTEFFPHGSTTVNQYEDLDRLPGDEPKSPAESAAQNQKVPTPDSVVKGFCPVCNKEMAAGTAVFCGVCDVPHHKDCWQYIGGHCAIMGCNCTTHFNESTAKRS